MQYYFRHKTSRHLGVWRTIEEKVTVAAKVHLHIGVVDYGAFNCSACIAVEFNSIGSYGTA